MMWEKEVERRGGVKEGEKKDTRRVLFFREGCKEEWRVLAKEKGEERKSERELFCQYAERGSFEVMLLLSMPNKKIRAKE